MAHEKFIFQSDQVQQIVTPVNPEVNKRLKHSMTETRLAWSDTLSLESDTNFER